MDPGTGSGLKVLISLSHASQHSQQSLTHSYSVNMHFGWLILLDDFMMMWRNIGLPHNQIFCGIIVSIRDFCKELTPFISNFFLVLVHLL